MRVRRPCCLLLAVLSAACYDYVPARRDRLMPGDHVAVELTTEASLALAQLIGPLVTTVEGRLTSVDTTGFAIAVTQTRLRDGRGYPWNGEPVRVPPSDVLSVRVRHLSVVKTGAVVVGGALGASAIIAAASGAGGAGRNTGGGGSVHPQ
jgi:hypothetical protein